MRLTLRNDFHGSEVRLDVSGDGVLTGRQVDRARRALCGIKGCDCGGVCGTRGGQQTEYLGRTYLVHIDPLGPAMSDGAMVTLIDYETFAEHSPGELETAAYMPSEPEEVAK